MSRTVADEHRHADETVKPAPESALIRVVDVLASGTALLLLSPLLLAVMAVLRVTGEGEVFFRQQRVGRSGRPFGLWKFVTMLRDSPNIGTGTLTLRNDPRVLPVGRVLRKAKINELPQLLNVLCGDMSVIGPRPQAPANFDCFPDHVKTALKTVRPGLSGIGSIVFRDEEGILERAADKTAFYSQVIAPYKGALELWYIRNRRPGTYLLLIALTAWVVAFPDSRLHWRLLPGLPEPPPELAGL